VDASVPAGGWTDISSVAPESCLLNHISISRHMRLPPRPRSCVVAGQWEGEAGWKGTRPVGRPAMHGPPTHRSGDVKRLERTTPVYTPQCNDETRSCGEGQGSAAW
jgi:hypothetical protein